MAMTRTELPRGVALTAYDVAHLMESGQLGEWHELIDGVLIEMPSPSNEHQFVQAALLELFFPARSKDMRVLASPFDILREDTVVQPDIVVIPRALPPGKYLEQVPLLAVEILSPSTALRDLNTKFKRYERAGISSYWVVDPITLRFTAWQLREGRYAEIADIGPGEEWTSTQPFAVTIRPADLLD